MMVDDQQGFAGMIINYNDAKARDTAIELGTDANSAHIKINGKDGLPRANLDVGEANKPAWQFDDATSAAQASQSKKH